MADFTYDKGEWKEGNSLPEQGDGEEFSDWLTRCGFKPYPKNFGNDSASIELYQSDNGEAPYLALVAPFGYLITAVFLPDFPSLMMFVRDFTTPFAISEMAEVQNSIETLLNKFFRVYHGHDPLNPCPKCDPAEVERLREFTRKHEQRKRERDEVNPKQ
jgi:hypothetical protein